MFRFRALAALLVLAVASPAFGTATSAAPSAPTPPSPPAGPGTASSDRSAFLKGEWPRDERTVTLDFEGVRTREALTKLATEAGWSLAFKHKPHGSVDMSFVDVKPEDALLAILRDQDLVAERSGDLITISDADERVSDSGDSGTGVRVMVGNSVRVAEGENVREAVAVGGSVEVLGTVERDAVAVGGDLVLGPNAVVGGNAVVVGGQLRKAPGAKVGGDRTVVSLGSLLTGHSAKEAVEDVEESWLASAAFDFGRTLLRYAVFFIVGLLLLSFAPTRLRSVAAEIRRSPLPCTAIGFLAAAAVIPLSILLIVTIIGILALPLLGLAVATAMLMGFSALALVVGEALPGPARRRGQIATLALGTLALFVVDLVPFAGFLVLWAASFLVFGAALRTKFGSTPSGSANFAPMP